MDNIKIPKELIKAIKENDLVLFVGAGLSYNFVNSDEPPKQLGDWKNLINEILNNIEGLDYLKPLLNKHEPIKILDLIENTEQKTEVIGFVKQFFSLSADNDYSLHEKLCRLSNKIITTNYDNAFEHTDPGFQIKTASFGRDYEFSYLHNPFDKTLFKLHGSITEGNNMIFFPSNYKKLYNEESEDSERIVFHLRNLITNKTILFLGYGMSDFQISDMFLYVQRILGRFHTKKHYLITKEKILDSKFKDFLTPISIDNFSEIETVIDELLKIKEEKDEDKIELEKKLEEVKEKLEYEKDRIKSLSLKYEKEGLEFSLKDNFEKSIEKFKISTELDPCNDSAFNNWSCALNEKFEKAVQRNLEIVSTNWGTLIPVCAEMIQGEALFNQTEKYDKVIQYTGTYNNWGNALSALAKVKQDETLFQQAFEKYEKATQINPEDAFLFYNWGYALSALANMKQDETLFKQACEKYEKATQINPDNADAFYNWGLVLSELAKMKQDETLFKHAFEKYEKAIQINPELTYNPSCSYALLGEKEKALHYLEESLKNKIIEIDWVLNDDDWKNYHSDDDFIHLINKYK